MGTNLVIIIHLEEAGARLARASPGQQGLEVARVQGVNGLVAQEEDLVGLRLEQVRHHLGLYIDAWVFIKGGCSRRGVQWMGVVLYNKTAYLMM